MKRGVGGILFCGLFILSACARGIYHQVRPGENLYRIGKAYGVPYQKLARINHLSSPARIAVGQKVFIPGAKRQLPVGTITPEAALLERPQPDGSFPCIWPLAGQLTSPFGQRGNSFHDGIDIGASPGTPVRAVSSGTVIYSDALRGYGNVVIVRHGDGFTTVYAHNQHNHVREGEMVRQGQVIGRVGMTGRTTGPNLHFEIRKDNVARNPLYYLPQEGERVRREGG